MADFTLNYEACYGTLTIDGVALMCPGWTILTLGGFYGTPAELGTDRVIPGVDGVIPYKRRATVTRHSLPMVVVGQHNRLGVEYPEPYVGMETNLAYLLANVALPTGVGDGTRTAVWTRPSGATITAAVHVLGLAQPVLSRAGNMLTSLEISDVKGVLHL